METPFYLQGTQTGGLLQNLQQDQQQYPANTQYSPGSGMPLYAAQTPESSIPSIPQGSYAGMHPDSYIPGVGLARDQPGFMQAYQSGTLNTYSPQGTAAGATAPATQNSGFTEIGKQFYSDAARNAAIMNAPINRTTSGGGVGGAGAAAQRPSGGATSGSSLNASPGTVPNSTPQFSGSTGLFPSGQPINYQAPQGQIQYGQPGSAQTVPQGGALQMQQSSPQNAIDQYQNTAGYQMRFGDQAAQNFQSDPGYQYAVDQAMEQVQQGASARGLLESGSALRGMSDRVQGMALQDYGNWWNRQNQSYTDYQNRLQGLAGGPTGADQAFQGGMQQGASSMQTGSNLASLFGNQGNAGFGGMTNTAAAQANSMNQAAATQAQIYSANQSTNLAGAIQGLF